MKQLNKYKIGIVIFTVFAVACFILFFYDLFYEQITKKNLVMLSATVSDCTISEFGFISIQTSDYDKELVIAIPVDNTIKRKIKTIENGEKIYFEASENSVSGKNKNTDIGIVSLKTDTVTVFTVDDYISLTAPNNDALKTAISVALICCLFIVVLIVRMKYIKKSLQKTGDISLSTLRESSIVEFSGNISGIAEKHFLKHQLKLMLPIFIGFAAIMVFIIVSNALSGNDSGTVFAIILIIVGTLRYICMLTKNGRKKRLAKEILITETGIVAIYNNGYIVKNKTDLKQVIVYDSFYEFVFSNKWDIIVICQKDMITKGSLEEFEEIFADKSVKKTI